MMNNELRPYDKYKETGIFWLDYIPNGWDWRYLSQIAGERCLKNSAGLEDNVLSLSYGNIIRKKNIDFGLVPKEYSNYQVVEDGNIILRLTDLQNDKRSLRTGLVNERGIITSAYTCLDVKRDSPKFVHYLLHAFDLMKVFYGMGGGVRQSIGYQDIRKLRIPIPPREEQDQIVKYLDYKLAKINKFIKAKRKLIAVLKEQKQAIINQAVTKGLDPDVRMKSSGIEWLGDVPEHWVIGPLKQFAKSNQRSLSENGNVDLTIEYLDISSVGYGEIKLEPVKYSFMEAPSRARRIVKYGDTIISTVRTYLKSMCFIDKNIENCIVSTGFAVLTPLACVYPKLLSYTLSSNYFVGEVSRNSIGISYPAINESKLMSLKVALPNTIEEQEKILEYITENSRSIDDAIRIANRELNLLNEYKDSLISSVVTGKVDIRNIIIEEFDLQSLNDFDNEDENEAEEELIDEGGDE